MNFSPRNLFNLTVSAIGLYGAVTSAKTIKKDLDVRRKRQARDAKYQVHNMVHAEESQIFFQDYFQRIKYAAHYIKNYKDALHIPHEHPREIYHSQMALLDDDGLATLLVAALTSEQFPLEYADLFPAQKIFFKPRQFRYVLPNELRTDAADLYKVTVTKDMLVETISYIRNTIKEHSKDKNLLIRFMGNQQKILKAELEYGTRMQNRAFA